MQDKLKKKITKRIAKDEFNVTGKKLTPNKKRELDKIINKVIEEYGDTLRMLGKS